VTSNKKVERHEGKNYSRTIITELNSGDDSYNSIKRLERSGNVFSELWTPYYTQGMAVTKYYMTPEQWAKAKELRAEIKKIYDELQNLATE